MSKRKHALIVVDVQNDFLTGGALAVHEGDQVIEPLNKLIREHLERGDLVIKTRDWHPPQTRHFRDFGGLWAVHCVQNTPGAEFHRELIDDSRITTISKGIGDADGYSGFDDTELAALLRDHGVEELTVGGIATDYCVKNTVLDALRERFRVRVISNAVRAVNLNPEDGARALEEMRAAGAQIESTNDERGAMN